MQAAPLLSRRVLRRAGNPFKQAVSWRRLASKGKMTTTALASLNCCSSFFVAAGRAKSVCAVRSCYQVFIVGTEMQRGVLCRDSSSSMDSDDEEMLELLADPTTRLYTIRMQPERTYADWFTDSRKPVSGTMECLCVYRFIQFPAFYLKCFTTRPPYSPGLMRAPAW